MEFPLRADEIFSATTSPLDSSLCIVSPVRGAILSCCVSLRHSAAAVPCAWVAVSLQSSHRHTLDIIIHLRDYQIHDHVSVYTVVVVYFMYVRVCWDGRMDGWMGWSEFARGQLADVQNRLIAGERWECGVFLEQVEVVLVVNSSRL